MGTIGRSGLLAFAISALFATVMLAQETESDEEQNLQFAHDVVLPEAIQKFLRTKLSDYVPVRKEDYDQVWFEQGGDDIPHWSAVADYDGNGKDDYAVLMKRNDDVALIVVRSLDKTYTHEVLRVEESDSPVTVVVHNVEPGWTNISSIDDPNPEKKYLKNPSLWTGILETCSSYRHYWDEGEWHKVYVGA